MAVILGKKIGMTQIFNNEGVQIPVTVIEAGPVVVTQLKTNEKDGYEAIQIGFDEMKPHRMNRPLLKHFEKAGVTPRRRLTEVKVEKSADYTLGQEIKVDIFEAGQKVDITGTSKGKGTQGHIRRWNHGRGPMSHGSKFHRLNGSHGASSTPARVFKGLHGPGRMGYETVTIQNLQIVRVDVDRNLLLVKGAVPGPKKGIVRIKSTVKNTK
ncbi:50S ribosomal protein L3 [Guggenheimella bovis]